MNKPQPFSCLPTGSLGINLLKSMCVDRDDEIKQCIDALFGRSENILIHGSRGVGKTFLVRLLLEEIRTNFKNIVPVFVNLTGLFVYDHSEIVSAFPNAVLLEVCRTIWVDVLGKEYLALRNSLSETSDEIKFRKKGERTVVDIYRLLMTSARRMEASWEHSVGVSAVIKGDTKKSTHKGWSEINILPFEFFEFAEEIKKKILIPNAKERIIAICDEANKLPILQQANILERYLQLFAAREVQFVFVSSYNFGEKFGQVSLGFQKTLELRGFPEKRHVKELIDKQTTGTNISFSDSAIDVVWEAFEGHPYLTIDVSLSAYRQAYKDGLEKINARVMASACMQMLRRMEEERRMFESHPQQYF